jgi:hypothetical protein
VQPGEYGKSIGEVFANRPVDYTAGMRVFDISSPREPREIGFMPIDGVGLHRTWYTGGRWAYASALLRGFSDYSFVTIDMNDPKNPQVAGQWWIPGQNLAAGETPSWDPVRWRYGLHHALVAGDTAYGAWRDGGLTVLDVADRTKPELIVHRNWAPPYGGGTHSPLPLPDRDLLVVADEGIADNAADGTRSRSPPCPSPTTPTTSPRVPISGRTTCTRTGPARSRAARSSSRRTRTPVSGSTTANAYAPKEIGAWVPPAPRTMLDVRPNRPQIIQSADVYVEPNGVVYLTDYNAGFYVLQFGG